MTNDNVETRPAGRLDRAGWPAQLRLPGQAAAPEGPVDMYMMYLMHFGFRRDLDGVRGRRGGDADRRPRHLGRAGEALGGLRADPPSPPQR